VLFYGRSYGRSSAGGGSSEKREEEERLMLWLEQSAKGQLVLTSVRLLAVFCGDRRSLMDRAFRHFAFRPGLRQLWLGHNWYSDGSVPCEVSIDLIRAVSDASKPDDGRCDSSGNTTSNDQGQQNCDADRDVGHPFAELEELFITILAQAMKPLATLLPSIISLSVVIRDGAAAGAAAGVLPPCASLRQLQVLRLYFDDNTHVPRIHFSTLQALPELRELSIRAGSAPCVNDDHLASVLRAMPRLRSLLLQLTMLRLSLSALRGVGLACPKLRRLDYPSAADLAAVLDNAQPAPLFPALEMLTLKEIVYGDLADLQGDEHTDERSVCFSR
jgi:hypothetical protein